MESPDSPNVSRETLWSKVYELTGDPLFEITRPEDLRSFRSFLAARTDIESSPASSSAEIIATPSFLSALQTSSCRAAAKEGENCFETDLLIVTVLPEKRKSKGSWLTGF